MNNDEQGRSLLPPTPDKPVAGFYRCPGSTPLWMYYDGSNWVGQPTHLAWYRRPIPTFRGRPPVAALAVFVLVVAVAVLVTVLVAH